MAKKSLNQWISWLWNCISGGADLYQALVWLFPTSGGLLIAWLAALEGMPSYLIAIYTMGAICLCSVATACVHYVVRYRAIFERLRYSGTEPLFVNPNPEKNTIGILFKCKLMNMSQTRSMYISLRRADARLQGKTNPEPELKDNVVIVPPFSDFAVQISAVPEIDVSKEIKGKLELEVAYGPEKDNLPYVLIYEIEPRIEIRNLTEKNAEILFTGPLKKYIHKRG